nr:PREDICTED: uncharacterized protein LOC109031310 isoform X1 [Bemisia tabaci]XP_018898305.1 PREDICTED: uncharacterized protein LOC109031310 isoform X1 [Bemisia tabaci]XP_018898306.1 PREDICTED: uncharacterized protein LOC109031310 isoform X1 [Bemisia tabaci]
MNLPIGRTLLLLACVSLGRSNFLGDWINNYTQKMITAARVRVPIPSSKEGSYAYSQIYNSGLNIDSTGDARGCTTRIKPDGGSEDTHYVKAGQDKTIKLLNRIVYIKSPASGGCSIVHQGA